MDLRPSIHKWLGHRLRRNKHFWNCFRVWKPCPTVTEQGLEVRVGDSLSGFIKRSDLARDRSEQRVERFAVDEKVDAIISQIDSKNNKLTLSIKVREMAEEKQAMAEFGSSDSGASLGDILGAALAKKEDSSPE